MNTNRTYNPLRVALKHSALALAAIAALSIGSVQALTFSLTGNGTNGYNQFAGEADGYKFTTGASMLVVSWLGFYDAPIDESGTLGDDLLDSHRVSIWRESDGVLMARTTVFPGDALVGNFRGRNVTPVVLAANTEYVIAADYGGQGDRMQEGNDLTGWTLNGITIQEGRFNSAGGDMPTDIWNVMIGPNFGYDLATLSVSLTAPADTQGYPTDAAVIVSANVIEPGAFTDTVTFHMTPTSPAGSTVVIVSSDTGSPFTADFGTLPAGAYEIYATVANDNVPPDTATSATRTFTVAAAIPTTTVLDPAGAPTTYGDNVSFTATVSPVPTGGTVQFLDGLNYLGAPVPVNTTTGKATYSSTLVSAGSRVITAEFSGHWLYEQSGTITSITQEVAQAQLTVKALNTLRTVNTANPDPLPHQITGYQNGQNLATSGVTGTPDLSTDATLSSPVGSYTITCALGTLAASNYSFTLENGTLTVTNLACELGVLSLNANGGINPATGLPWAEGDTYRLIFVTSGTTACDSTDITTYNTFVQGLADAAGLGTSTLGPVIWKVVGSTATVDARDNTDTNPGVDGVGEPILRMDGTFVIANNYADLWDGINNTHVAGENYLSVHLDENGAEKIDERVRTGSGGNGTASTDAGRVLGGSAEGTPKVTTGRNYAPDFYGGLGGDNWMQDWSEEAASAGRVYAISEPLTILNIVPPAGFNAWANANDASGQTADQDHDNDGVENGIEYFMGETGSSFTAMPGLDGTNTVTWPMDAAYVGTYEVQTSPDLGIWTNVDPRPAPSGGNLSFLLPPGLGKQFVRLQVTPTP